VEIAVSIPPTGTVTFLFTDIQGSTRLWEQYPDEMRSALVRHDQLLHRAITDNNGTVFKTVGDAFCAAFATAPNALQAALAAQQSIKSEPWNLPSPFLVRMGLHTGAAEERGGDYFGQPLNRVARLMSAGHGGQILLSGAAQELTLDHLPTSVTLRDLGQCRLKDLGRPEHIYQAMHPSLPADFPPLKSLDNPDLPNNLPNNLPQQVTSFIGREKQVEEVTDRMGRTRLLTLTGAGGSGKTRLSLQIAADLLDRYFDGAWLVELAPLTDPALVPQAVAHALGIKEEPGKPVLKTVMEWLKPKRLLLILDNCEHLIAACASLATDLLRSCPNVHILASSREPLNISGEQSFRVPSLALPDPKGVQTMEALSQFEAVRLFIERAQAVQPSFAVTNTNAPAVAQVCFHLDGIPLAIELAAARVRALSVEEINARLDNRFRLLTGGSRTALPRQQTLRALIDWSYDLLTEKEKALLCRLAVFAGGWTLEAAEKVVAGGDEQEALEDFEVLDLLTALVDKSLVAYEEDYQKAEETRGSRYRLLETVRQYAGERLGERGEAEVVRDNHLSWCVALADKAGPHLQGPDGTAWLTCLETEHDNLRAGLTWAGTSSERAGQGLHLAGILAPFWHIRGHWSEARSHLEAALGQEGAEGSTMDRARALNALGTFAFRNGDWQMARRVWEQALAISREMGNRNFEAANLSNLGNIQVALGDFEAALSLYEQALAINLEMGNRTGEAANLYGLGNVKSGHGEWEAARSHFEQSLAICREIGNNSSQILTLQLLGSVLYKQGQRGAAHSHWEQALLLSRELGNRSGEARILRELGIAALDQGALPEARRYFVQCLILRRQLGEHVGVLDALEDWAALTLAEGDAARAACLLSARQREYQSLSVAWAPDQKDRHEKIRSAAHSALGDDAFRAACDAGQAMTLEQAADYAMV
jgi:predicted ATPase/class 3 adenylate cyclase